MRQSARSIAPLLFLSGFCALIYQVAWTREFRLIFGATTATRAFLVPLADRMAATRASPSGHVLARAQMQGGPVGIIT